MFLDQKPIFRNWKILNEIRKSLKTKISSRERRSPVKIHPFKLKISFRM